MKHHVRTAILIIFGFVLFSGKKDENTIDASLIENSVSKIGDNLYAGKTEVPNFMYHYFLYELRINNRMEDLKTCQIDSLGWIANGYYYQEPLVTIYGNHPAYNNYPVVNISHRAAMLFCDWLTNKYNSFTKRKFNKVKFRLPSQKEWMYAAHAGHPDYKYANGDLVRAKKNGEFMYNFNSYKYFKSIYDTVSYAKYESAMRLVPCKSFWANDFGLYNMSGNAAEMVDDNGIAKGGSFLNDEDSLRIDVMMTYDKSACNLGFRYFMDVINPTNGNDYPVQKQ